MSTDSPSGKPIDALTHDETRANIPPAELEPVLEAKDREPIQVAYERRNPDLDPQLVWRGKDVADWSDLVVTAPPVFLQEQVHPKALIDDLRAGRARETDLFGHFGVLDEDREAEVEFYRHSKRWANRMILGDSLQVMASLAEREGLRGKVQCIYIDPPYGIRFNSNFQWSTTSRDVKDGNLEHLTREPEQVKAFRDTWRDGIHSYLTYLRDRLTVARDLLTESGSCFVQIGDENVHRVRALMDEVFGEANFVSQVAYQKTTSATSDFLGGTLDFVLWFSRDKQSTKFRPVLRGRNPGEEGATKYTRKLSVDGERLVGDSQPSNPLVDRADIALYTDSDLTSQSMGRTKGEGAASWFPVNHLGRQFRPSMQARWKTNEGGFRRLLAADRIEPSKNIIRYIRKFDDFSALRMNELWMDIGGIQSRSDPKVYVVQTSTAAIQRCILMTTDPGDLVLDPTCGSGTTAQVSEQWGRRWITVDTSRVALALARSRLMGARYPWYVLADSPEGQLKEAEVSRTAPATTPTTGDLRHGFVYERVPHITLKSIANNTEIDVIWERLQPAVEAARTALNAALRGHPAPFPVTTGGRAGQKVDFRGEGEVTLPSGEPAPAGGLMEWEVPREAPEGWPAPAKAALEAFWQARIARQKEIDASIAARADTEYLYDKPYEDRKRVRVAGPFTVESLSPHRMAALDEEGELIDMAEGGRSREAEAENYTAAILENLRRAGVHQPGRADRIAFESLTPWPGDFIAARGAYMEGDQERKAGIFIGPEYGTVQRRDLRDAAVEAADADCDIVIACAFNFDVHASEFRKLGRIPVLHARMNPDLHMAGELKAGGGNLFVIFGEPDIALHREGEMLRVEIRGVDVFKPQSGEVVSHGPEGIACWFVDTDYSGESFFVRQAYFPGTGDPYKALKTTLKAEIDEEAWETLRQTISRPFPKPRSGRIAVKAINHLGDEVMKVFGV